MAYVEGMTNEELARDLVLLNTRSWVIAWCCDFAEALEAGNRERMQNIITSVKPYDEGAAKRLFATYCAWDERVRNFAPMKQKFLEACRASNQKVASAYKATIFRQFPRRKAEAQAAFDHYFKKQEQAEKPADVEESAETKTVVMSAEQVAAAVAEAQAESSESIAEQLAHDPAFQLKQQAAHLLQHGQVALAGVVQRAARKREKTCKYSLEQIKARFLDACNNGYREQASDLKSTIQQYYPAYLKEANQIFAAADFSDGELED